MKKYLAAAITSALALQLTFSAAWADYRYAKACIKNETTANMKFSWKFGDDPWKHVDLVPGNQEIFWYEYAKVNADRSPYLYVRYDARIDGKKEEEKSLSSIVRRATTIATRPRCTFFALSPAIRTS